MINVGESERDAIWACSLSADLRLLVHHVCECDCAVCVCVCVWEHLLRREINYSRERTSRNDSSRDLSPPRANTFEYRGGRNGWLKNWDLVGCTICNAIGNLDQFNKVMAVIVNGEIRWNTYGNGILTFFPFYIYSLRLNIVNVQNIVRKKKKIMVFYSCAE